MRLWVESTCIYFYCSSSFNWRHLQLTTAFAHDCPALRFLPCWSPLLFLHSNRASRSSGRRRTANGARARCPQDLPRPASGSGHTRARSGRATSPPTSLKTPRCSSGFSTPRDRKQGTIISTGENLPRIFPDFRSVRPRFGYLMLQNYVDFIDRINSFWVFTLSLEFWLIVWFPWTGFSSLNFLQSDC